MAFDREEREALASAIRSYMRCEIDNFRFDELLRDRDWNDELCWKLSFALWHFYCDTRRHHFDRPGCEYDASVFSRWEALLHTDLDFATPERLRDMELLCPRRPGFWGAIQDFVYGRGRNDFWPLASPEAWEALGIPYVPRPE